MQAVLVIQIFSPTTRRQGTYWTNKITRKKIDRLLNLYTQILNNR